MSSLEPTSMPSIHGCKTFHVQVRAKTKESKMRLKFAIFTASLIMFSGSAFAVNICGGQTSTGNPMPCCDNGGNCTWWGWKQANDANWPDIPTGNANTWGVTAASKPTFYNVSKTPTPGAIGVKNSSPYTCIINGKSVKNGCDTGHVAYITRVNKDKKGNITDIDTTQMACGGSYGVSNNNRKIDYFDSYITPKNLDGEMATAKNCSGTIVATTVDKSGNKLNLYWSSSCKTNWAQAVGKTSSLMLTATITRSRDNKSYQTNGFGVATSAMVQGNGVACATGKASGLDFQRICK